MIGLRFHDNVSGFDMMLITKGEFTGWLARQEADGRWVTLRLATKADHDTIIRLYRGYG